MFEDLLRLDIQIEDAGPLTPLEKASTAEISQAQADTAALLRDLGITDDETLEEQQEKERARKAFETALVDPDDDHMRRRILELRSMRSVEHFNALLNAFDFEFVDRARELRNYTVARILKETDHPDAKVRLKALKMLGDVTEIGVFTQRVEVTTVTLPEEEVEKRLRERILRAMEKARNHGAAEIVDVQARETPQ